MTSRSSQLATAYLNRALRAARIAPTPRPKGDSRTADKFIIRGYEELYAELDGIGRYQGRSRNSEVQSAVLEALGKWNRTTAMLNILVMHLGSEVSEQILKEVPDFELSKCKREDRFVLRFPPNVRQIVRSGIESAELGVMSMNDWFLRVLVRWVNVQRQHYALLSAAMAMNPDLFGEVEANHE